MSATGPPAARSEAPQPIAIPATIFYNKFVSDVNKQAQRLEGFADEFAAILSRQIDERG